MLHSVAGDHQIGLVRTCACSYIPEMLPAGGDQSVGSGRGISRQVGTKWLNIVVGEHEMSTGQKNYKWLWLTTGLVAGISISTIWPHEPVSAATADRNDKFAMITCPVSIESEAVFVLDFLTGKLSGALLYRTRNGTKFTNFFYRNLATDFQIGAAGKPYFAISCGKAAIPNMNGIQWGTNALFVAELKSGKVASYGIPYKISQRPLPPVQIVPLDSFSFREATVTE